MLRTEDRNQFFPNRDKPWLVPLVLKNSLIKEKQAVIRKGSVSDSGDAARPLRAALAVTVVSVSLVNVLAGAL